jgi:GT2 family glycosyltransferase
VSELPSISVLIPCRNAARWLPAAIVSALSAKGVTEVIVADDGSTDDSAAIAEKIDPRVRVLRLPPRGGNAARNAALQAAHGTWLQFLDADDYLEPAKIADQLFAAGDLAAADVLYSPVWIETWQGDHAVERTLSSIDPAADPFTQWITWQMPQTGGALWRADALRRIGGWNEAMPCCQEHELYARALQAGLRWKFCPTPGAVYRIWSEETVCRKDPVLVIRTRTALIDGMLAWLEQHKRLQPAHRAAAAQVFFELARTWAQHDLAQARGYLAERRARTGVRLAGPAAPMSYRVAYYLLGFGGAERLARRLR